MKGRLFISNDNILPYSYHVQNHRRSHHIEKTNTEKHFLRCENIGWWWHENISTENRFIMLVHFSKNKKKKNTNACLKHPIVTKNGDILNVNPRTAWRMALSFRHLISLLRTVWIFFRNGISQEYSLMALIPLIISFMSCNEHLDLVILIR